MKRKHVVLALELALLLCLSAGIAWAAGVVGKTLNEMTTISKTGGQNGPWTISASGQVGIDNSVKSFKGLKFSVTDPSPKTTYGYTNLPGGPPKPGGLSVTWEGTVDSLTVKGEYSVVCTMQYTDSNGNLQTLSSQGQISLP